jgi:hypothetical protein
MLSFPVNISAHGQQDYTLRSRPRGAKDVLMYVLDSELSREKMWARIHLIPLLQAEEDRDQVRRHFADKAREKDLLGVETRVYNTDKFVRPTFSMTPEVSK